jgi:hypothetical protein
MQYQELGNTGTSAEIDAVSKPSEIYPEWVFDLHRGDRIPGGSGNYSDLMKSTV